MNKDRDEEGIEHGASGEPEVAAGTSPSPSEAGTRSGTSSTRRRRRRRSPRAAEAAPASGTFAKGGVARDAAGTPADRPAAASPASAARAIPAGPDAPSAGAGAPDVAASGLGDTELLFDPAGPVRPSRRVLEEMLPEEVLAREYVEELAEPAPLPIEGEVVDERTADEDRPMLKEIVAGERDRRRQKKARGSKKERRPAKERGRDRANAQERSSPEGPAAASPAVAASAPEPAPISAVFTPSAAPLAAPAQLPASLADVGVQMLRTLSDPRPVHARQLAAMALKRKLASGDPEDLWRVMQLALLDDIRARQARGLRPRVRHQPGGLFALASARVEPELARVEESLERDLDVLARETRVALRRRLSKLSVAALESVARLYLERIGYRDLERIKRVESTSYLQAIVSRAGVTRRLLVAVRAGGDDLPRRAVGELRAGVLAKKLEEGLLLSAARLGDEAERELGAAGPPVGTLVGDAWADELIRAGVGVVRTSMPVCYLDVDFLVELVEG